LTLTLTLTLTFHLTSSWDEPVVFPWTSDCIFSLVRFRCDGAGCFGWNRWLRLPIWHHPLCL